jgi:hypothetical protein
MPKRSKIEITEKQMFQFNRMFLALKKISKEYMTPKQLRKDCEGEYGLDFEETIEMSYENIQAEAASAIKGVKGINNKSDLSVTIK